MAEVRQGNGPKFAMVPEALIESDWTDPFHRTVYEALKITADFGEAGESVSGCYEKISRLADKADCSPRTFHSKAADLRDKGWIEWESGIENGGRNRYVVHWHPVSNAEGSARDADQYERDADPTNQEPKTESQNTDRNEDVDWQNLTPPQRLAKSTPNRPCPRIAEVFQHVREARAEAVDKQIGPPLQLTTKRHNKIRARLKEGWTVDQLKNAYSGLIHDDWHAEREKFEIEYCFRNDEKVRDFLRRHREQMDEQDTSQLIESDKEEYLN